MLDVATGTAEVALWLAQHPPVYLAGLNLTEPTLRRGHDNTADESTDWLASVETVRHNLSIGDCRARASRLLIHPTIGATGRLSQRISRAVYPGEPA